MASVKEDHKPLMSAALEKETGKEYEYIVYKNPVASTESLGAVYSISSSSFSAAPMV